LNRNIGIRKAANVALDHERQFDFVVIILHRKPLPTREHITGAPKSHAQMSDPHVVSALRRKRAEVAGMIRDLDGRVHALRRDLAHIDATLKLFDAKAEPRLIKPVRPYRPRNRLFEKKELSIRVMNALREGGAPMTIEAITERIMREKGLDEPAGRMIRGVVAIALRALKRRAIVTVTDETPARWAVKA
jgi:hypothetical protein